MRALAGLLSFLAVSLAVARPTITVGVLEGLAETEGNAREGVGTAMYKRHVRVLFRRSGPRWEAYPHDFPTPKKIGESIASFPSPLQWNVCYEAKPIAHFSSRNPRAIRSPALIGSQNVFESASLPEIGRPSTEFGGYRGEAVPRPLLLTTGASCSDPDIWRRDEKSAVELKALTSRLRAELAKPGWERLPENAFEPPTYKFSDSAASVIQVIEAKRDGDGRRLVFLHIIDKLLAEHVEVFYLPPDGSAPHYIGASMKFVGAFDFDSEARSLVVLKMEAQNRDGYVLLDREMRRAAEFFWSYR